MIAPNLLSFRFSHQIRAVHNPTKILLSSFAFAVGADAALVFYATASEDEVAFKDAAAAQNLVLLGRESFADLGVGQAGTTPTAVLAPGVPAGALFPNGTDAVLGLQFQTNSMGETPNTLSPGGVFYAVGPFAVGERAWIGPDSAAESVDIIIDPPDHRGAAKAISLAVSASDVSAILIKVYDANNNLLDATTVDSSQTERIAILSTADALFRVNLFAASGFLDVGELDVYVVVPEPSLGLWAGVFSAATVLMILRRRHNAGKAKR